MFGSLLKSNRISQRTDLLDTLIVPLALQDFSIVHR